MRYGVNPFKPLTDAAPPFAVTATDTTAEIDPASEDGTRASPNLLALDDTALDALIERVEHARRHELALSGEDLSQLLGALTTLAHVHERLEHSDLTIGKLKRLLGIARSSEGTRALAAALGGGAQGEPGVADGSSGAAGTDSGRDDGKDTGKKPSRRSPPRPRPKPAPPEIHKHPIRGLDKGQCCPDCGKGRLYKFAPAEFTRVRGNPMYTAERHVMEQLRCNACQSVKTAELPEAVRADGARGDKYGYSALALMGIAKYFGGDPFFRHMTVQGLLGVKLHASTIFDQCERLATALHPVYRALQRAAATAALIHIDDTTHRILSAVPVKKQRGGQARLRSGVYASMLFAAVHDPPSEDGGERAERRIALVQTNIGHAGEWLDEVLAHRPAAMAAPVVMSDALGANRSVEHEVVRACCNAHARRGFFDVAASHPDEALHALEQYQRIWVAETHCQQEALSPEARLAWHREHSAPVMEALKDWCAEQLDSGAAEANGALGQPMRYVLNHFDALTLFCRVQGAPLDNNVAERLIKLIVRNRKNSGFYKTQAGADVSDVITSVLATCHENQVNAFEYLVALQRHSALVRRQPERWLPWNYEAALAEQRENDAAKERAAA